MIQFGCQTYTWQMSYEKYKDSLADIMDVVRDSGMTGVEAEVCMLGDFYNDPGLLREELARRQLMLAALTLALPWRSARESKEETEEADKLIAFLRHFPQTLIVMVHLPGEDRRDLASRRLNALSCIDAVARRATDQGIVCALHPNSPEGSVFRTMEDYLVMFDKLDERYIGYAPDSGHIANGGMDAVGVFETYRPLIRHVHFKDLSADSRWKAMGEGIIDHPAIVRMLKDTGYDGWVMVEEESDEAVTDPDGVTLKNGLYVNEVLKAL